MYLFDLQQETVLVQINTIVNTPLSWWMKPRSVSVPLDTAFLQMVKIVQVKNNKHESNFSFWLMIVHSYSVLSYNCIAFNLNNTSVDFHIVAQVEKAIL